MMYSREQTQLAWDLFNLYTLFTYTSIKFCLLSKKKGAWRLYLWNMRSCQVPTKDQFYYNVITAWTWSHLIQGISENLKFFIVWKINHLKRDCNKVARALAQFAKCSGTNQVWKGVSPPMVQHLIQLDKTLMFYCISLKLFFLFLLYYSFVFGLCCLPFLVEWIQIVPI